MTFHVGKAHSVHKTPHAEVALLMLAVPGIYVERRFELHDVRDSRLAAPRRFQGLESRLQMNARSQRGSPPESHRTKVATDGVTSSDAGSNVSGGCSYDFR